MTYDSQVQDLVATVRDPDKAATRAAVRGLEQAGGGKASGEAEGQSPMEGERGSLSAKDRGHSLVQT